MDLAGGLRGLRTDLDRPGAALVLARREKTHQSEDTVARRDQFIKPSALDAELGEEQRALLRLQFRHLRFDGGADHKHFAALRLRQTTDLPHIFAVRAVVRQIILRHVRRVDGRLGREQIVGREERLLLLVLPDVKRLGRLSGLQMRHKPRKEGLLLRQLFVHAGAFFHLRYTALQDLQIREEQFVVDRLDVTRRIDAALHMNHVRVLKTADHVHDGVHLADMAQKLVAQALALSGTLHQTGNIHKLDGRGSHFFRVIHLPQQADPLIRHRHDPHIRINRAERIIRGLRARSG